MDAFKRQASKLREQVVKQQQAVIKHISSSGYESSEIMITDEVELQRHHELEKLYRSARANKDLQKEIVRASEACLILGSRQTEVGAKFSEECLKYANENSSAIILAKAASLYGEARAHVGKEQEDLNRHLSSQVVEPLKAMITGAPLEDARHLAQRYSRMRQEAEAQVAEVSKRQTRAREVVSSENAAKLHLAESKMQEFKANLAVLGKEAAAALSAVEAQQQRLTFQRLVAMIDAEKTYHQRVAAVLDQIQSEMVSEKQQREFAPPLPSTSSCHDNSLYFLAEVIQNFEAETEKELSLCVGNYVVVRQVSPTGWSEGECNGKAGWFPSAYVERRQRIPADKVPAEVF